MIAYGIPNCTVDMAFSLAALQHRYLAGFSLSGI